MPSPFSYFRSGRSLHVGLLTALLALGVASAVTPAHAQIKLKSKVKPLFGKVASPISDLYNNFSAAKAGRRTFSASSVSRGTGLLVTNTSVRAEIAVIGSVATVRSQLVALGVQITGEFGPHFDVILPINLIDDVGKLPGVAYVAPNYGAGAGVGAVTSQGDRAMRADIARSNGGVDGTGQKVGAISDTFDNGGAGSYATDKSTGDLPAGVNVVQEYGSTGEDEGRAMLQIVHDVAPGAGLAFATGFNGQAGMAQNIGKLRTAGCTVITDDIYYYAAPFFMDGLVSKAIDQCVNAGVPYFTIANNQGHDSYETTYNSVTVPSIGSFVGPYDAHDFDPGPGVDVLQKITIPAYSQVLISFEWDDQWKSLVPSSNGATSDFNIYLFNATATSILAAGNSNSIGGDPVEVFSYYNNSSSALVANLSILRTAGTGSPRIKYISFNGGATIDEYATNSGTAYGPSNASRALTLGAAVYAQTPRYGHTPALLEYYSSRGGIPILRDANGNSITPVVRAKPDLVAIDGVDTTFFGSDADGDGFPNFFGTSAAAPHAAAVAALLLQKKPSSTPDQIYNAMRSTALDMGTAGFDYDTGNGLLNAELALNAIQAQSGPDFVVTNNTDTGDGVCNASGVGDGCSLREAINAANADPDASTITFDSTVFGSTKKTISLTQGNLPIITSDVSITGPITAGAGVTLQNTDNSGQGTMVVNSGTVAVSNLTLTGGYIGLITNAGSTTATDCTFTGNKYGLSNGGTVKVNNCTISGNDFEGLYNFAGTATVDSCTITGNLTGIYIEASSTVNLSNSLDIANTTNIVNHSVTFNDNGYNITSGTAAAAGLDSGGLKDNGGPTQTIALVGNGTALNMGSTTLTTDQRGLGRPFGSADDIGAYELQNSAPVISSVTITPSAPLTTDDLTAHVESSDAQSDPITHTYVWKKGASVIAGQTDATLPASQTEDGDSITVTVTANDGQLDSDPVTSAPVTIGNQFPTVDFVSPQGVTDAVGTKRTFTLTMSDANGASDLREMWLLINTRLDWDGGATLVYRPSANSPTDGQLFLRRGDNFLAPITIGAGASSTDVLDNGAVRIIATDVTVSVSKDGNSITLNLPLTIRDGLVGNNTLFARAQDTAGTTDPASLAGEFGFIRSGSYTVTPQFTGATNSAPTLSKLTPGATYTTLNNSGLAPAPQTFGFFVQDADGIGDIQEMWLLAGPARGWAHSATFVYYPRTRRLVLRSDDGNSFLGGGQIGSAGIIENSQVKVDLSKVIVRIYPDGKTLGLSLPLQAKSGLVGTNGVWLRVQDTHGATSLGGDDLGFVRKGNWNVKASTAADAKPSNGNS